MILIHQLILAGMLLLLGVMWSKQRAIDFTLKVILIVMSLWSLFDAAMSAGFVVRV